MNFIFLTNQFYEDYSHCTEIEMKQQRPYVQVFITLHDIDFAIPMRSNIKHNYAFWTDKPNRCGLDYSKAIVIEDRKYIDATNKPYIRPNEFKALIGREYSVKQGLLNYIQAYKKAKLKPDNPRKRDMLEYSALQYFEGYI
ncbi:MAG: hypothetical protein FWB91_02275 [Defluviitaleaceae bacterium]|nr:hypothetical protein [Defluviitaleaceae bacterium]